MTIRCPLSAVGVVPRGFDVGERHGAGNEFETSTADFGGDGGQFGQDVAGRDRALPAADDLQADGTQCCGEDFGRSACDGADFDPG
ncbi:MAG TPA: hypothetical protein VGO77_16100 [Mycobacterium sp.]|jgi:hypothetical protein|nr:hypothetical protein [Mycobacterium sp.]